MDADPRFVRGPGDGLGGKAGCDMNTKTFAETRFGSRVVRVLGAVMESRLRYRFFPPAKILQGVDGLCGRVVLEVGCGTGYFTIPAARLIGDDGRLVAMDVLPDAVALVSEKVRAAGLGNTRVVVGDALDTHLDDGSFDTVLLFGVIPAPMLPMDRLLAEMRRVLKPEGILAVWPPVPGWLPGAVARSDPFVFTHSRNGVSSFRRC